MNIPDSAASEPGVYRELSLQERAVYDRLLSLSWVWARKFIVVLSFGKRLSMDTMPSMAVVTGSDKVAIIVGSYESSGDGLVEVDRDDGTKGLSGGFSNNMLHEFAVDLLTRSDPSLAPHIVVLDALSPNPANARVMFQGEHATELPWKLDCREYRNNQTEGERIAQDRSVSEMLYAFKEVKDLSGKPFVCAEMGNLLRLDVDVRCAKGDREEIEVSDMAHTTLRLKSGGPTLSRTRTLTARMRHVARTAWLKAARINAKKSLATRGYLVSFGDRCWRACGRRHGSSKICTGSSPETCSGGS